MAFYPLDPEKPIHFLRGSEGGQIQRGFIAVLEVAPPTVAAASVLALTVQPTSGTTVVTAGITAPTVPACVSVVGNQATCTGNLVVAGTNTNDQAITETIAINGTTTVQGVKAFKTITSITIPTRGAASDQVSVGVTKKIGLFHKIATAQHVLKSTFNGAADAGTLTVDATDVDKNVYAVAGTPNGTNVLIVAYLVY